MERVPLTKEGYEKLKKELEHLKTVELPSVANELRRAREFGDLSENAEYSAAKEKQELIQSRIARIENILSRAQIVEPPKDGVSEVVFGVWVKIRNLDTGEVFRYRIVGEEEVDINKGYISHRSPIGRSLIGKMVGEIVEVRTPNGERVFEIMEISVNGWKEDQYK